MENDLHLNHHISNRFNKELEDVRSLVMNMGGLVEQQLSNGLNALLTGNLELAEKVVATDHQVNAMEVDIDEKCTQIIARRQPAASDLRLMVSIIKTITDLERIGDEAAMLGKNALALADSSKEFSQIPALRHLGEHVSNTLTNALNAYARLDLALALQIIEEDKIIDEEFNQLSRLLLTQMMENPQVIKDILRISWCARALERIGDHTKNICEYLVYLVKGKDVRHMDLSVLQRDLK